MLGRLFFRMIGSMFAFAAAQFFVGMAIIVRLLPTIAAGLLAIFRISLILSFRLDRLMLEQIAPLAAGYGVNITRGLGRIGTTIGLSLVIGAGVWWVIGWHMSWLLAVAFAIHGLIVGLAWDEIEKPGGLQMGVKIE
jgi:hypothetical protein